VNRAALALPLVVNLYAIVESAHKQTLAFCRNGLTRLFQPLSRSRAAACPQIAYLPAAFPKVYQQVWANNRQTLRPK
jgi:hypothetical protein